MGFSWLHQIKSNCYTEHSNYDRTFYNGRIPVWLYFLREKVQPYWYFSIVRLQIDAAHCSVTSTNSLQERRIVDITERGGVRRRLGLAPSGAAAPALSASLDAK